MDKQILTKLKIISCILTLFVMFQEYPGYSQELNLGGSLGIGPVTFDDQMALVTTILEYKPSRSIFSINTQPLLLMNNNDILFSAPLYLKFSFGNKFRVCPAFGGFLRTNGNYGWLTSLIIEQKIKNGYLIFLQGEFDKDFWKETYPKHLGGTYEITSSSTSVWISIGFKKNLFHHKSSHQ